MSPFASLFIELRREFAIGFRGNDRGDAALQHVIAQPIGIKSAIRQQVSGGQVLQQRAGFAQVMGLPWHQAEVHKISKRIRQGQYLGGYATSGTANGLAESPPFAPWPERWTLTMVPSIMTYSKSEPEDNTLNIR
jgi:hypothetical protein